MKILVVIPTWKRQIILPTTEKAWANQTSKNFELVWVGDAESHIFSFGEYHKKDMTLIQSLNYGISLAKDRQVDWLVIFDDDALPNKNYIEELEKNTDTPYSILGGPLTNNYNVTTGEVFEPKICTLEKPQLHWDGSISGKQDVYCPFETEEIDILQGCSWAIHTLIIDNTRFDEKLSRVGFRYETDFQLQLRKKGYHCFINPKLYACHRNAVVGSFCAYEHNDIWRGYDHARFSIKHFGLLRSLIGIILTNHSPRPIWIGIPISLFGIRKNYWSWYIGYAKYLMELMF